MIDGEDRLTATETRQIHMPLGVVLRRTPGVTRWAKWYWQAVAVLPGAGPADWKQLRCEGDTAEYHAATLPLTLYRADTEAYMVNLADHPPSIYVIIRNEPDGDMPLRVAHVTASPYEAQDYNDSGEELVEKVAMPPGLVAWLQDFTDAHHEEEVFVKRRRDRIRTDRTEDGRGDMRIRQDSDVYRSPRRVAS